MFVSRREKIKVFFFVCVGGGWYCPKSLKVVWGMV